MDVFWPFFLSGYACRCCFSVDPARLRVLTITLFLSLLTEAIPFFAGLAPFDVNAVLFSMFGALLGYWIFALWRHYWPQVQFLISKHPSPEERDKYEDYDDYDEEPAMASLSFCTPACFFGAACRMRFFPHRPATFIFIPTLRLKNILPIIRFPRHASAGRPI